MWVRFTVCDRSASDQNRAAHMSFPENNPTPPSNPFATPASEATPDPVPSSDGGGSRSVLRPLLAAALMTVLIAAFGGAALSHALWPAASGTPGASSGNSNFPFFSPSNGSGDAGGTSAVPANAASVATHIDPGLVDINTETAIGPAAGTGMVVTSSGEVITNNHVIDGATAISATDVGNGRTYTAHVIGYDRTHDVAVLMLQGASGLATVPLGSSSTVHVGASVLTFGNAGGVGGTPSVAGGSITALHQAITASDPYVAGDSERLNNLIQINGQIEPGDSGGPLVLGGKVVGMDTAASVSFSFQSSSGEGFAIPVNQVLSIARQIVAGISTSSIHIGATAVIGVYVYNTAEQAAEYGCQIPSTPGAVIDGAITGMPGAAVGISQCDTITALGGKAVTSASRLLSLMETHHPGDSVSVTWLDTSGVSHTATVRLATGAPD
jgi:S1-C subfamily serine protease